MIWYYFWKFLTVNSNDQNLSPLSNNVNTIRPISIPSLRTAGQYSPSSNCSYLTFIKDLHIHFSSGKMMPSLFPQIPYFLRLKSLWNSFWDSSKFYTPPFASSHKLPPTQSTFSALSYGTGYSLTELQSKIGMTSTLKLVTTCPNLCHIDRE